jgi:hypothetical protein
MNTNLLSLYENFIGVLEISTMIYMLHTVGGWLDK